MLPEPIAAQALPNTVAWDRPARELAAAIADAAERGTPLRTFLAGIRIELGSARPSGPARGEPGTLTGLGRAGAMQVATVDRQLSIASYRACFAAAEEHDLRPVLAAFGLAMPTRLGRVPFASNDQISLWEAGVRRWDGGRGQLEPRDDLAHDNAPWLAELAQRAGLPRNATVLDVGCLTGWACRAFAAMGCETVGIDVSAEALEVAQAHDPGGDYRELDYLQLAGGLRRDKDRFDLVFCRSLGLTAKLVDWEDRRFVVATRALARSLRPEGVCYWIERTQGTGRVEEDGFSNAPLERILASFRAAGLLPAAIGVLGGLISLTLVRADAPPRVARRIVRHDRARVAAAIAALRADGAADDGELRARACRAAALELSQARLALALARPQGGPAPRAALVATDDDPALPVYRAAELLAGVSVERCPRAAVGDCEADALVVLDPAARTAVQRARRARDPRPQLLDAAVSDARGQEAGDLWVVSADQDRAILDGVASALEARAASA